MVNWQHLLSRRFDGSTFVADGDTITVTCFEKRVHTLYCSFRDFFRRKVTNTKSIATARGLQDATVMHETMSTYKLVQLGTKTTIFLLSCLVKMFEFFSHLSVVVMYPCFCILVSILINYYFTGTFFTFFEDKSMYRVAFFRCPLTDQSWLRIVGGGSGSSVVTFRCLIKRIKPHILRHLLLQGFHSF